MRVERRTGGFPWEEHYCLGETVSASVNMRGGYSSHVFIAIYLFRLTEMMVRECKLRYSTRGYGGGWSSASNVTKPTAISMAQ
jgi:hypothetical protein